MNYPFREKVSFSKKIKTRHSQSIFRLALDPNLEKGTLDQGLLKEDQETNQVELYFSWFYQTQNQKYNKKYPSLDAEKFAKNNNNKLLLSIKTRELIKMNITTIMVQENTAKNSFREGSKASSWTSWGSHLDNAVK